MRAAVVTVVVAVVAEVGAAVVVAVGDPRGLVAEAVGCPAVASPTRALIGSGMEAPAMYISLGFAALVIVVYLLFFHTRRPRPEELARKVDFVFQRMDGLQRLAAVEALIWRSQLRAARLPPHRSRALVQLARERARQLRDIAGSIDDVRARAGFLAAVDSIYADAQTDASVSEVVLNMSGDEALRDVQIVRDVKFTYSELSLWNASTTVPLAAELPPLQLHVNEPKETSSDQDRRPVSRRHESLGELLCAAVDLEAAVLDMCRATFGSDPREPNHRATPVVAKLFEQSLGVVERESSDAAVADALRGVAEIRLGIEAFLKFSRVAWNITSIDRAHDYGIPSEHLLGASRAEIEAAVDAMITATTLLESMRTSYRDATSPQ